MKLKINDQVKITGGKDDGRQGKVLKVMPKEHKVVVEGLNLIKKHRRAGMGQAGGILDIAKPLDVAKVALVCPQCHQATRVGYEVDDKGNKTRICRKCKKNI